jgi:hypothetical protein
MPSRIYLVILTLIIGILACASPFSGQQEQSPLALPTSKPFIEESYPTSAADAISSNQVVSGIDVRVERAWQEGKQVYTEVCFTLPDTSDWIIWKAGLKYDEVVLDQFGATLLSSQASTEDGQLGKRCDTLEFYVPPDANLSTVIVSIESIAPSSHENDYCTIYMPKIQQAFNERGIAITLACTNVNGIDTMQIVSKPETMSQEEAEQLVYSDEFFTIKGPWEFSFNLGQ